MEDLTKINLYKLQEFKTAPCEVFAQLPSGKILTVCKTDMVISEELINKLSNAEGCKIYVRTSDYPTLHKETALKAFAPFKDDLKNQQFMDRASRVGIELKALQVVQHLLVNVGLSDYAIEMASETLEATMYTIEKIPAVSSLIRYIFESQDIYSKKCLLISYIALGTLSKTEWNNEANRKKLSLACFLCDTSIDDSSFVLMNSEEDMKDLSDSEKEEYINHPTKEAGDLNANDKIPNDVVKIVAQHHERPEGDGFPNKLDDSGINHLAAILILSQDLVFYLLKNDFNKTTIKSALYDMKERNFQGKFEQVYNALCTNF